jgi:hypothetical protein
MPVCLPYTFLLALIKQIIKPFLITPFYTPYALPSACLVFLAAFSFENISKRNWQKSNAKLIDRPFSDHQYSEQIQ